MQFVRFEFVVHSQKKTKIIRACNFDMNLDIFELCSEDLKAKLKVQCLSPTHSHSLPRAQMHAVGTSDAREALGQLGGR